MNKRKIHCIEIANNPDLDKLPMKKLQEMVGWIEYDTEKDVWDVTMADGCGFECSSQTTAQILASSEETKAILMEYFNVMKGGKK